MENNKQEEAQVTTAREKAYQRIRNAIFSGTFKPGYQLKEEALAQQLDLSRTPVRQAIHSLADEGLVDIKSNRRSYVADINETQFEEIFEVLLFLEGYSAGLAATRIPATAIDKLRNLNEDMSNTYAPADNPKFLALNSEFHKTIHQYSGSQKVEELLLRIIDIPDNLYLKFNQIPDWHNAQSVIEHNLIIESLASGDPQFVTMQMRAHTASVRYAFSKLWLADEDE